MSHCIKFMPDHSINLNIRRSTDGRPFPEHTHDCTELAIVMKGSASHLINGHAHPARAGDVYVIKPGVSHGFADTDGFVHYVFSYMPDMLDSLGPDIRRTTGFQTLFAIGHSPANASFNSMLCLSMDGLAHFERLAESIIGEFQSMRTGYESLAKARFVEIITLLLRSYDEQGSRGGTPLDVERAARLASHLECNFKDAPGMPSIARRLGVSERQLRRIFGRHYGMSPLDYLMKVRINRAASLLNSSDMTLPEIAFACGFTDANYLSRQFKSHTGISPSRWRERRER
jgi:AraC-like DNA-binding protein